jgi:hypothetical protein
MSGFFEMEFSWAPALQGTITSVFSFLVPLTAQNTVPHLETIHSNEVGRGPGLFHQRADKRSPTGWSRNVQSA